MSFYFVVKSFMLIKNSVRKIQNLAVNHESEPIKLNPCISIYYIYTKIYLWWDSNLYSN